MAQTRGEHERKPSPDHPEVAWPEVDVPEGLLAGQKAVVTGASRGIGRACAVAMAKAGADVVVTFRSKEEQANEVAGEIRKLGRKALVVKADVSREDEVLELFRKSIDEFGTVDILLANAGMEKEAPFEEIALEDWEKVISVNLTGAFLCAREAVKEFKRRGVRKEVSAAAGKIIFTSSVHDKIPWRGFASYTASKGGLLMLMKSMALELGRDRVRVNAVSPGAIATDINRDAWETPEAYRELLTKIPYNRVGEPGDVARTVAWLASDQADYISGQALYVDGGMTLYPSFESGG